MGEDGESGVVLQESETTPSDWERWSPSFLIDKDEVEEIIKRTTGFSAEKWESIREKIEQDKKELRKKYELPDESLPEDQRLKALYDYADKYGIEIKDIKEKGISSLKGISMYDEGAVYLDRDKPVNIVTFEHELVHARQDDFSQSLEKREQAEYEAYVAANLRFDKIQEPEAIYALFAKIWASVETGHKIDKAKE